MSSFSWTAPYRVVATLGFRGTAPFSVRPFVVEQDGRLCLSSRVLSKFDVEDLGDQVDPWPSPDAHASRECELWVLRDDDLDREIRSSPLEGLICAEYTDKGARYMLVEKEGARKIRDEKALLFEDKARGEQDPKLALRFAELAWLLGTEESPDRLGLYAALISNNARADGLIAAFADRGADFLAAARAARAASSAR